MSAFYDGKYDILLSTTIVESGLDIPTANTLIVHRADMFGLAQLYQLRGRVGRSKLRAYALFTLPAQQQDHGAGRAAAEGAAIAGNARRRLPARLARSRYPRRRQSARRGTVRPHQGSRLRAVSVDAGGGDPQPQGRRGRAGRRPLVAADHRRHAGADPGGLRRRPRGAAVAVPAARRPRHRRARSTISPPNCATASACCRTRCAICSRSPRSRRYCRRANVEKVDAGPKGAVITFRDNKFAQPDRLVYFIRQHPRPRGCGRT